jgi:hypothetical protein
MEKTMDLIYFGYNYEEDSRGLEIDFKKEVKEKFDSVELKNAYDQIKGYRQEVYLPNELKEDYYMWLISEGWFQMSMNLQLTMQGDTEEFKRLIEVTKIKYPEAFKKEALS